MRRETDVFTTAEMELGDFLKQKRKQPRQAVSGAFAEARKLYEADHSLVDGSKRYAMEQLISAQSRQV